MEFRSRLTRHSTLFPLHRDPVYATAQEALDYKRAAQSRDANELDALARSESANVRRAVAGNAFTYNRTLDGLSYDSDLIVVTIAVDRLIARGHYDESRD